METPTPTRIADAPTDTPGADSYTPEQIQEQVEQIAKAQESIDALKKQIKMSKAELGHMIAHVEISSENFKSWVFNMYWTTDGNTPTLRKLVKQRLGDAHHTWKSLIEGSVNWPCSKCEAVITRAFTSKSAWKAAKSTRLPFLCPACQERHDQEYQELRAKQEARHEQQEQRLDELRSMIYAEYLQTPEWNETRKAALKRARYACQTCNAKNTTLHVHHRTYERIGNEYARDLTVLCADCHAKLHEKAMPHGT